MPRISLDDYLGHWSAHTDADSLVIRNATELLRRVNILLGVLERLGADLDLNPATHTLVSGQLYGGFRPQSCPEGAPRSAHKTGEAVDVYDADGDLDDLTTDAMLEEIGLYREHPSATRGWFHLTTRAPKSKRRSFYP